MSSRLYSRTDVAVTVQTSSTYEAWFPYGKQADPQHLRRKAALERLWVISRCPHCPRVWSQKLAKVTLPF
jgi:hypothetical protein